MELSIDERFKLITSNLQETLIDEQVMKKIMAVRPLKIYWGTAPTGPPSIAYFIPMMKIRDLVNAGCEVVILIADLHAVLDNLKSTFKQVEHRVQYYIKVIQEMLLSLGVDVSKVKFIKGSDFQLTKEYTLDMYKAHTLITFAEAKHAGASVVKQDEHPKMCSLMYPTLQALDIHYLNGGCDIFFGGIDQRKIAMHEKEIMPKLGFKKKMYLFNRMISGLRQNKKEGENTDANIAETKMSSSNKDSKIDLMDTKNILKAKINKCYCLPGDIEDNCLMEMLEGLIFPILQIKGLKFVINRPEKFGGIVNYDNVEQVKNDFKEQQLHPGDFKNGMIDTIDSILDPIRKAMETDEVKKLIKLAYS